MNPLLHRIRIPLLLLTLTLTLTLTCLPIPSPADPDRPCRDQCGTIAVHYPFGIDDGCGAPQFRHMFTCNTTSYSLFFVTPNGNYKVQSVDYKAQTMTVYDPDMSTCTILQPHHDLLLSDLQYAIIPPSPDTVFALLNCSLDSPLLHRFRSLCFDLPDHRCQDLYSSCNSFHLFTSGGISSPAGGNFPLNTSIPGIGTNTGVYYGIPPPGVPFENVKLLESGPGYYGAPNGPGNFPVGSSPPGLGGGIGGGGSGGNYFGAPPGGPNNFPPPGLGGGIGGGGSGNYYGASPGGPSNFPVGSSPPGLGGGIGGGGPGNYYGAPPGGPSTFPVGNSPPELGGVGGRPLGNQYGNYYGDGNRGGSESVSGAPACCFTGYSTMKVMSMDILDCTHFTSFYDAGKLKGVGPMEWSYGLRFSYSVPDMGCERCKKSGGSCGFDAQTEALLCLCPNANNSTRQCGTDDLDAGEHRKSLSIFQACIIAFGVLFLSLNPSILLASIV